MPCSACSPSRLESSTMAPLLRGRICLAASRTTQERAAHVDAHHAARSRQRVRLEDRTAAAENTGAGDRDVDRPEPVARRGEGVDHRLLVAGVAGEGKRLPADLLDRASPPRRRHPASSRAPRRPRRDRRASAPSPARCPTRRRSPAPPCHSAKYLEMAAARSCYCPPAMLPAAVGAPPPGTVSRHSCPPRFGSVLAASTVGVGDP